MKPIYVYFPIYPIYHLYTSILVIHTLYMIRNRGSRSLIIDTFAVEIYLGHTLSIPHANPMPIYIT
jgi:hypothetical protein